MGPFMGINPGVVGLCACFALTVGVSLVTKVVLYRFDNAPIVSKSTEGAAK
jgi:hypothetical protein